MTSATKRFPWRRYLAPRYWPVWCAFGLLRIAAILPYRMQLAVGRAVGRVAYRLLAKRRRIARANVDLCLPELDDGARARLVRAHFQALGIGVIEAANSWWKDDEKLKRLATVEGLHHLDQARADGVPVILLSAHFTTLEIGGHILSMLAPINVMYRRNDNPLLQEMIHRHRRRRVGRAIQRDSVKEMMRSLRNGEAIWYAPDQNYRRKHSAAVPFFGHPAPTNTATARLARATGARVIPFVVARLPGTAGYSLRLDPPLAGFPTDDVFADTQRINQLLEAHVREVPEQYLWIHRRFKGVQDIPDPYL